MKPRMNFNLSGFIYPKGEARRISRMTLNGEKGAALILAFGLLLVIGLLAAASVVFIDFQASHADRLIRNTQAYYLAEAGYVRALKAAFDARAAGQPVPASFTFTETLRNITFDITVTLTNVAGTDKYIVKSEVK